ncbi:hypothetical protein QLX08_007307 [Tetragonisca angustula]|uniref:Uncharacterized protein n=1 Tax=Tetragonisca angustula TaxID=166442 RepID=A0AAW0ZQJ1_9HYME
MLVKRKFEDDFERSNLSHQPSVHHRKLPSEVGPLLSPSNGIFEYYGRKTKDGAVMSPTLGAGTRVSIPSARARPGGAQSNWQKSRGWLLGLADGLPG